VVAIGLGPFAGVMALFVHTTGILAKLFSEAVEAIDPRPVEGIRATGASKLQEVVYGVVPQVLPLWISFSLYRFESNVRSATVLGLVGAGGIGQVLFTDPVLLRRNRGHPYYCRFDRDDCRSPVTTAP
jgi:phosphonate transport system permease protein